MNNLSELRILTTFYTAKNDHRWVIFTFLKTIKPAEPDRQRAGQAGGPEKADDGDEDSNVSERDNVSGRSDDVSTGTSGSNVL